MGSAPRSRLTLPENSHDSKPSQSDARSHLAQLDARALTSVETDTYLEHLGV
jgi:hypothetical protein